MKNAIDVEYNETDSLEGKPITELLVTEVSETGVTLFPAIQRFADELLATYSPYLPAEGEVLDEEGHKKAKAKRTDLRRTDKEKDAERIAVRKKILEDFDAVMGEYKKVVAPVFEKLDEEFSKSISVYETKVIQDKQDELEAYWKELCKVNNIDFLEYKTLGLNVTFSKEVNPLKKELDAKIGQIVSDLTIIEMLPQRERIKALYVKSFDVKGAIDKVKEEDEMFERIAREKKQQEEADLLRKHNEELRRQAEQAVVTPTTPDTATQEPVVERKEEVGVMTPQSPITSQTDLLGAFAPVVGEQEKPSPVNEYKLKVIATEENFKKVKAFARTLGVQITEEDFLNPASTQRLF